MNKFKGTEGNWEVVDNGLSVFTENRIKSIAFDGQICRLHTGTSTYKNAQANAKLISKDPELLEELIFIVNSFELGEYSEDVKKLIKEATTI